MQMPRFQHQSETPEQSGERLALCGERDRGQRKRRRLSREHLAEEGAA